MTHSNLTTTQRVEASLRLRQCLLFSNLPPDQFETILQNTRLVRLREAEILFEQLQPAREIFLLEHGQIKLGLISPEGHEKVIDLISAGNSFAEAIMFSGNPAYPVTATALIESSVWCINAKQYEAILRQSTSACFAVMAQMSRRLHWQVAELDRLTLHNATFRLMAYLLEHVPSTDLMTSRFQLDTPKHVVASRLSITPETLSRTFAKLSKEGYLDITDNTIKLNDIERMRRYIKGEDS